MRIQPTNVDIGKLTRLVEQILWLDDGLFEDIRLAVESLPPGTAKQAGVGWPESVHKGLISLRKFLWVDDCLMTTPSSVEHEQFGFDLQAHDRELLGGWFLGDDLVALGDALRSTRSFSWLIETLRGEPGCSARFGTLSARLHDSLVDDPRPYRRHVKELLANLIAWIEYCQIKELFVERYSRTLSISIR